MKGFRIRSGIVPGREHIRKGINCQDAFSVGEFRIDDKEFNVGIVCDGCSEGAHSEVGSNLLATFIRNEVLMLIASGVPVVEIPTILYHRCVGYLRSVMTITAPGTITQMVEYVKSHLQCTAIGFVMDSENLVLFHAGDGVMIVEDEVTIIDQHNRPMYLAYHLVPRLAIKSKGIILPDNFTTKVIPVTSFSRLAVCSDGIETDVQDVYHTLWGHDNKLGLQRTLKKASTFDHRFADDCTVITLEKVETEGSQVQCQK